MLKKFIKVTQLFYDNKTEDWIPNSKPIYLNPDWIVSIQDRPTRGGSYIYVARPDARHELSNLTVKESPDEIMCQLNFY